MIVNNYEGYEGPRTPRENELAAVAELSRSIFFEDETSYWEALRSWPMFLRPNLRQDILTMFKDGQPVSTIGRLERDILVHGHRLRMGFIGGVCTHPDHRGKGLASTILDAMMAQFHQDNVDFVYISGTRRLYFGAGANHAAIEKRFVIDKSFRADDLGVQIHAANLQDIDMLVALAERESVRFIRPRSDFELVMENEHCGGRPCKFYFIELRGIPVGYLLLRGKIDSNEDIKLIEFVGDRLCILSALEKIVQRISDDASLEINIPHGDLLIELLSNAGAQGKLAKTGGTMKVIDFCRTMRKLFPYFKERLAGWACLSLNLTAGKERYVAWNEKGTLELEDEDNMLWTLLGKPPDALIEGIRATGQMEKLVEQCLPIPVPLIYFNVI
jgi:GNAT superfamily N-acetyltransferase